MLRLANERASYSPQATSYDIFHPKPTILGNLYDGVQSRNIGTCVVSMGYVASESRSRQESLLRYSSSTVVFHRRGSRDFAYRTGQLAGQCQVSDGQVSLLPAGIQLDVQYHESCEGLVIGLAGRLISEVAADLEVNAEYPLALGLNDPALAAISESFWNTKSSSPKFLDHLGRAMLVHIFENHRERPGHHLIATPSWLKATESYIQNKLNNTLSLDELSEVSGLSRAHFARSFKQITGVTPLEYVSHARVQRARELMIANPELSLAKVAAEVGFCDQSHFTKQFRDRFGITPAASRRNPSTYIPKKSTLVQDRELRDP